MTVLLSTTDDSFQLSLLLYYSDTFLQVISKCELYVRTLINDFDPCNKVDFIIKNNLKYVIDDA